jgi:hypothetical protein
MNQNPNKQNKLRMLTGLLGGLAALSMGRIKRAKLELYKMFGEVKEGGVRYRQLCPKGAGMGPKTHTMEQRNTVGARKFFRKSRQLQRDFDYLGWRASK